MISSEYLNLKEYLERLLDSIKDPEARVAAARELETVFREYSEDLNAGINDYTYSEPIATDKWMMSGEPDIVEEFADSLRDKLRPILKDEYNAEIDELITNLSHRCFCVTIKQMQAKGAIVKGKKGVEFLPFEKAASRGLRINVVMTKSEDEVKYEFLATAENSVTYLYDGKGKLISVTAPEGMKTEDYKNLAKWLWQKGYNNRNFYESEGTRIVSNMVAYEDFNIEGLFKAIDYLKQEGHKNTRTGR